MTDNIRQRAEELARQPYTEVAFRERTTTGGYVYVAVTPELEGCVAQGETMQEALDNLRLFRVDYIEHLLENSLTITEPSSVATSTAGNSIVLPSPYLEQDTEHSQSRQKAQVIVENDTVDYA